MSPERKGDWIQTYSGIEYYPLDPRPDEVLIEDISHALSNICRYAGHTSRFYSVAEHSILVSKLVAPEHALTALLHDATEAYLVDVPRPIKRFLTNYNEIEQLNWLSIADRFDLPSELPAQVVAADNAILVKEMTVLMRGQVPRVDTSGVKVPDDMIIIGMYPEWAKASFMARFKQLYEARV